MMAILLVSSLGIWAQEDEEYRMEIGGGIGVTGYLGDFNSSLTKTCSQRQASSCAGISTPTWD